MKAGNLQEIMKQAQAMQEKFQQVQRDLAHTSATGESGAGLVKVTMTGKHDVTGVFIDESLLKEDKQVLEDLIAAAINDAVRRIEYTTQEKMSKLTGGIPVPAGFKMPF